MNNNKVNIQRCSKIFYIQLHLNNLKRNNLFLLQKLYTSNRQIYSFYTYIIKGIFSKDAANNFSLPNFQVKF